MSKLKPCPSCGFDKVAVIDDYEECIKRWGYEFEEMGFEATSNKAVNCPFNEGGCGATGGWRRTEAEAIEAWNRRANDEQ